jgi:hypothetical protein
MSIGIGYRVIRKAIVPEFWRIGPVTFLLFLTTISCTGRIPTGPKPDLSADNRALNLIPGRLDFGTLSPGKKANLEAILTGEFRWVGLGG